MVLHSVDREPEAVDLDGQGSAIDYLVQPACPTKLSQRIVPQ